jgi:hypothetical protein
MSEVMQRAAIAPTAPAAPTTYPTPVDAAAAAATAAALVERITHPAANDTGVDHRLGRSTVWKPASSARIQTVEGLVILGTMGYFAYGLAAVLGVF